MDGAHSLLLDEEACSLLDQHQRAEFLFQWLGHLKKLLPSLDRDTIKQNQQRLIDQLSGILIGSPGPPTRRLLAHCLALVYHQGDPLPATVFLERCNDIIRSKDDSPSGLPTRLAALACIGSLFEQLGRFLAGSFRDTLTNLLKAMKSAESQGRYEIMSSLERILRGLGISAMPCHREVYKAARTCLMDRSMEVRCAAAKCLLELQREASFLWSSELENVATLCFRALEGSNSSVRVTVARLLGSLLAAAVEPKQPSGHSGHSGHSAAHSSLEEVMDLLLAGFLRGGAGFLRTSGDMLKGTSSVGKDVRIGVTQAYVVFISSLGSSWLETNLPAFLSLLMDLACHPKATQTAVEAAVTRRCVSFILRSTLGSLLGEKAQTNAAKQLSCTIAAHKPSTDENQETRVSSSDVSTNQHLLVCCLLELGSLVQGLGSTAAPLLADSSTGLLDSVLAALLHPRPAASLAAAWCLRCLVVALPSQCSQLLDHCTQQLLAHKSSPGAVVGYGAAVAALVAAVQHCPLGIPHSKGLLVLDVAEELLRSAAQNSRVSLQRTRTGWLIISALITLGPAVVEHHLSHLLLLWRCVFPASLREQDLELRRGDDFTWQVTLEGRAGALCAMKNLLLRCRPLLTDDVISRLPLPCAVTLLTKLPALLRSYGASIRSFCVVYTLRVYELLALLPPHSYQESFGLVMNQLVSDVSSQENLNQPCSELLLLPPLCHQDDLLLIGPALQQVEHHYIEEELHGSSVGGASLDNDPFSLCESGDAAPSPLPAAVALTAAAVRLFGVLFPHIISAQRVKILEQFVDTVNQLKAQRHHTVHMHICAALCSLLQRQGSTRGSLGPEEVRGPLLALLSAALESSSPLMRCLAAEGLARLVQVVGDPGFSVSVSLLCFDRLKMARDAASRSGFALALGALQRYTGGIGSAQHLSTCLGILFTLSQDHTSPEVQTWSLHSLALVMDQSASLYRLHAPPTFTLVLRLLLGAPPTHPEVHHSLGRCLHGLITCLGPDLQGETPAIAAMRSSCLLGCSVMQASPDPLVQSRAISCLQELHMFCPAHVNLAALVPALCEILLDDSMLANLCSSYLSLRRAVVACLRQLVQREALEVSELAVTLVKETPRRDVTALDVTMKEVGLEGALFTLLDRQSDCCLQRDIQETLIHMMSSSATTGKLGLWLKLCKDVLSATSEHGTAVEVDDDSDAWRDDDSSAFRAAQWDSGGSFTALGGATRRFAMDCICRIIAQCETADPAHFNMALAQERRLHQSTDFLVLHLGDLVRMAFMAATDHSDQLRLAGLQTLLVIIRRFSDVPEPEFPGHVILEQYQANVGAALRPAFSADASPDVTAKACQVCSAWIGSGVVSDLQDLRRVHQLLVSSLVKVQAGRDSAALQYSEAIATMETLAVLKAWAQVYIVAVERSRQKEPSSYSSSSSSSADCSGLLKLVQSDQSTLSRLWLAALQDYALLTLPQELTSQLPAEGGSFYTPETVKQARAHYSSCWAPILHATSLWLHSTGFVISDDTPASLSRPATPTSMGHTGSVGGAKSPEDINSDRLHLILGISVEFLCSPHSEEQMENITSCLRALEALLDVSWPRAKIGNDQALSVELLSVLHRLIVTRESQCVQLAVVNLLQQIVTAAQEHIREKRHSAEVDDGAAEKETLPEFGEGRDTGGLVPGRSLVFGALELCLCVLVRKLPQLSPKLAGTGQNAAGPSSWTESDCKLLSSVLSVLSELPSVCSPEGSVSILPTVLYLLLGVFRELVNWPTPAGSAAAAPVDSAGSGLVVQAALQALKSVVASPMSRQEKSRGAWKLLLRSALSSLLELWNAGEGRVDQAGLLTALTVFLLSAGPDVCAVEPLHSLCLQRFTSGLEAKEPQVVNRCCQLLTSIFQAPPTVAVPYIQALGPRLLLLLQAVEKRRPQSAEELAGVLEGVRAFQVLVQAADQAQRPQLLAVLLPLLISFLLDENALTSAPAVSRSLHEVALQDLMKLGPQYSAVFRSVMASSPQLKCRLEAAVKGNQENQERVGTKASSRGATKSSPSITLKTNFL